MPILAAAIRSIVRIFINAVQGVIGALRWLARQAYRQRALGVAATPRRTRLLDLHFVTVAAHLALIAGLLVAFPSASARDWLLSLPLLGLLTALGLWRGNRLTLGGLVALQLAALLVYLLGARQPILLTMILAAALAQQVALLPKAFGRATAAGLLLGVFTGGGGLLVGLLTPTLPLWVCAGLLSTGLILALRMPRQEHPKVPQQAERTTPEGYVMYRPSSLDDPSK